MNLIGGIAGELAGAFLGRTLGLGNSFGGVLGALGAMSGANPAAALERLGGGNDASLQSALLPGLIADAPQNAASVGSLASLAALFG